MHLYIIVAFQLQYKKNEKMKTNSELQTDVQNAIKWEPLLNDTEISVSAEDGIVALTGIVDNYVKKIVAENTSKKVIGVKALVEKIDVKIPNSSRKTNTEIANEVLNSLKSNSAIPIDKITVKVEDGWVTLGGELMWNYQKEAAKKSVDNLMGVRGITNNIIIKSETNNIIEQKAIENAIDRNWDINDWDIHVKVSGKQVILSGTVKSWYQKDEAERICWNTPGISEVDNDLEVN